MSLEQLEREKYERIWTHKDYRANSPGERLVPYFLDQIPGFLSKAGESIVDLGCGTGRAGAALAREGFNVFLLDHVNAVDPVINLPLILANLWELEKIASFHWFYCCDVMEHIPPEKVDAVLDNIAGMTTKGGFFQIALFPDEWYGETLHLTVESREWWTQKLLDRWQYVTIGEPEKRRMAALVRK